MAATGAAVNLDAYLAERRAEVDRALERFLPAPEGPGATIARAMRYAVQAGGKRLRPILALTACEMCGGTASTVEAPAVALELVHTYSLIHDDLPAMDDDDLRRGKPTVHKAFGEAEAILAGDALNTLAFELLSTHPEGDPNAARRARAVALIARRSGIGGMVGGQIADLEAENRAGDEARLIWIHEHKTAALLSASTELGAIHAGADEETCAALAEYGRQLGLGFQIADDILDCTSTAGDLGKTPGKDRDVGKLTFPALYGIEGSRQRARDAVSRAVGALERVGVRDDRLEALARFSIERAG